MDRCVCSLWLAFNSVQISNEDKYTEKKPPNESNNLRLSNLCVCRHELIFQPINEYTVFVYCRVPYSVIFQPFCFSLKSFFFCLLSSLSCINNSKQFQRKNNWLQYELRFAFSLLSLKVLFCFSRQIWSLHTNFFLRNVNIFFFKPDETVNSSNVV